ncbi:MAG: DUF1592 domain-containing protein [Fimbriimonas sp.]
MSKKSLPLKTRTITLAAGCALFAIGAIGVPAQKPKPAAQPSFEKAVKPFLAKHCIACHSGEGAMAGADLSLLKTKADIVKHRELAERAIRMINSGLMPPKGQATPAKAEKLAIAAYIQSTIATECDVKTPGRVTMRRLNRLEYNNTIRDLTGLNLKLADDFPSDDVGHGFDNIGDVLSISPLLMEKYLKAAEVVSTKLIIVPDSKPVRFDAATLKTDDRAGPGPENDLLLFSQGEIYANFDCRIPGEYKFRVRAYGQQAGPGPCKMELRLDGVALKEFEVKATQDKPQDYELTFNMSAGKHKVGAAFTNDFYEAGPPMRDRNLIIRSIDLTPPIASYADLPATHKRIIAEAPTAANRNALARKALSAFASKAFRRPASAVEVDRLMQIADLAWKNNEPFERGIQLGVQAALSSPHFLFRVEAESGSGKVGSYELATRLSYFLWSSMPDDQLFRLAANGEIQKPAVLEAQAKRMLKDPKIAALGEAFAAQWLNLRKLNTVNVDPATYKGFDEYLRQSMMTETRMFFDSVIAEDRKVTDFLDGKYTFLNETLAKLYGMEGVIGKDFRKVSLEGTPRAGLLTQASILTLTSNPTRTSPVKRGKWVLEQILNDPPPPPPPGVPDLPEPDPKAPVPVTMREKLAQHLKNPVCASCHTRMDPIGFSLENFDGIGRWRSSDGLHAIDAQGTLPDGTTFNGAGELRSLLLTKKSQFVKGLSEKLLTFATGRGIDSADKCFVDEIAARVEKGGDKFSSLVAGVVLSEPFRLRGVQVKKK